MKNWKRYLALALLICFAVTIVPIKAHADALTASMVASAAYAAMTSWGVNFTAGSATGAGMSNYMTNQVESYVNSRGGSLTSLFGSEIMRLTAGKLVVGQTLYNGIVDFFEWMGDKFGLTNNGEVISEGTVNGTETGNKEGNTERPSGLGAYFGNYYEASVSFPYEGYGIIYLVNSDNAAPESRAPVTGFRYTGDYGLTVENGTLYVVAEQVNSAGRKYTSRFTLLTGVNVTNTLSWSTTSDYYEPQPLPQNKQGEYSFPGWAEPPTDLPDFLSRIPVGVANNNLVVTEEITEAGGGETPPSPSPSPEPGPSYNKGAIALLVAEIVSIINSLSGDTAVPEETIESLADSIADTAQTVPDAITQTATQTQTAIQDATQTITDTMTDTQTQTQTAIQDATQTITDTLTDTQTQTQTAIQDATQTITDTITDISEVPDDFEPQKHPLPRGVFPFCIPFDLHDFIVALSAEPVTPEIHVPFDLNLPLPGGNVLPFHYQFDLDLHDFDGLAAVLRTLEFIAFGVGLLFVTGKVIKW